MDYWKHTIDFLGLSTEEKPTENIVDGSTFYAVDTVELYVYYKGTWYLQEKTEEDSEDNGTEEDSEDSEDNGGE